MDKRKIKQLVTKSITNNTIDEKIVTRVVNQLTRKELKLYIKGLQKWVRENTVIVEVPSKSKLTKGALQDHFINKDIVIKENPALLLGVRIRENDDIYEVSLSNTLRQMEEHVLEIYDR